jgi:hypothetical protein
MSLFPLQTSCVLGRSYDQECHCLPHGSDRFATRSEISDPDRHLSIHQNLYAVAQATADYRGKGPPNIYESAAPVKWELTGISGLLLGEVGS